MRIICSSPLPRDKDQSCILLFNILNTQFQENSTFAILIVFEINVRIREMVLSKKKTDISLGKALVKFSANISKF